MLFDAIMCHSIFLNQDFWNRYENKLLDIISKEQRSVSFNSQNKDVQISLNFLTGDIEFLKIIAFHPLPNSILSKFKVEGEEVSIPKQ